MKIEISPIYRDISSEFRYETPAVELFSENRIEIVHKLVKAYDLSFNDIKIDNDDIATNHLNFLKYENDLSFKIGIGVEAVVVKLRHIFNLEFITTILNLLNDIIGKPTICNSEIAIFDHFESNGSVINYLDQLNPKTPDELEPYITSKGSSYALRYKDDGLDVVASVSKSMVLANGLFFHLKYNFDSQKKGLPQVLKVVTEKYDFITSSLGISYLKEGKNEQG